jgi:hypothetical protein
MNTQSSIAIIYGRSIHLGRRIFCAKLPI